MSKSRGLENFLRTVYRWMSEISKFPFRRFPKLECKALQKSFENPFQESSGHFGKKEHFYNVL